MGWIMELILESNNLRDYLLENEYVYYSNDNIVNLSKGLFNGFK
ncbi:hypothetical protein ACQPU1_07940 [Clostridium paraputrificum]